MADWIDQMMEDSEGIYDNKIVDLDKSEIQILMSSITDAFNHILRTEHQNITKINSLTNGHTRLSMACPYCGDSQRQVQKTRGNLYVETLWYKCYNDPCVSKPLRAVINDFQAHQFFTNEQLSYIDHQATIDITVGTGTGRVSNTGTKGTGVVGLEEYLNLDRFGMPRSSVMNAMNLVEVNQSTKCINYIKGRHIYDTYTTDNRHMAYSQGDRALVILNLSRDRTKVMGVQKRFIEATKYDIRFNSSTWEQLVPLVFKIDPETIDTNVIRMMSKVTLLFNFFQADYRKPTLILESGIDSMHIPNSIGLLSASVNINLRNGLYMYDSSLHDETGRKRSLKRLDDGFKVFLWTKFCKAYPIYKYCKDLNEMYKVKPLDMELLLPYFSNDMIDIMDV